MTEILANAAIRKEVTRLLGYSRETVSKALNGRIDTDAARRIRKLAKELGGAEKQNERVRVL